MLCSRWNIIFYSFPLSNVSQTLNVRERVIVQKPRGVHIIGFVVISGLGPLMSYLTPGNYARNTGMVINAYPWNVSILRQHMIDSLTR